jgi:hypothetical protein
MQWNVNPARYAALRPRDACAPAAERHIKAAGSRTGLAVRRGALLCALALLPAAACAARVRLLTAAQARRRTLDASSMHASVADDAQHGTQDAAPSAAAAAASRTDLAALPASAADAAAPEQQ